MRCADQMLTGLKLFCGIMNMRSPLKKTNYTNINNRINDTTKAVKKLFISYAVKHGGVSDLSVTWNGTWITRGYTSQHGVCRVIGSKFGEVIDTKVFADPPTVEHVNHG
ncbi:hypothetical protein R5R35_004115 [Gryllus longicercus]|uniref:Uncharacterized protein n=1 Tax=Gryllus longicercus TaxID=2509291 RepID=A0AAN9VK04_9ORTH